MKVLQAWDRKELKQIARTAIKNNYWRAVGVCLILAVFAGAHSTVSTYSEAPETPRMNYVITSNTEVINAILRELNIGLRLEGPDILDIGQVKMLQARRGVLASFFNNVTQAGSFLFGVLNAVNHYFFKDKVMESIVIFIGSVVSFLYWIFVGNILRVGECRFFMENHSYPKTRVHCLIHIYRVRRTRNAALIMLLRGIYTMLWSLTVVGGLIKWYSYRMVPYLLAENPDIDRKEAFLLSRRMMNGQKWRVFMLDMSFIFWHLLSMMTFGILGYLYLHPYTTAAGAALYISLREESLAEDQGLSAIMNDEYLVNDGFSADGQYPADLYAISKYMGRKWLNLDYNISYSANNLILMFFFLSIFGWVWEICVTLFTLGIFVNRGTMLGPWLPIYGVGGALTLLFLRKWADKPLLTFFLIFAMCGVIEYFTGWLLELLTGAKWWDYSGYFLNLHGRISLEGLIVFGLVGCFEVYFAGPILNRQFNRIPEKYKTGLCALLVCLFLIDLAYSAGHPNTGLGITYNILKCF